MKESRKIVFYDGDCGFCNHSVAFILKNEKSSEFYFAALQSDFTRTFFHAIEHPFPKSFDSVLYYDGLKMYDASTAALQITKKLKTPLSWLQIFLFIPSWLRNPFYYFIAKRRKRLAKDFCFLPKPEQRKRFLE